MIHPSKIQSDKRKRVVACVRPVEGVLLRARADMGSVKHQVAGQGLLMGLMPGLLLFHAEWTASKSRPQPKVALGLIIRDMERRAGEHCRSMKRLSLPVQALADEVSKVLCVRCVHHVEVVSVNIVSKCDGK